MILHLCLDIIWVIISVEVNGILGVTQQMNDLPIGQKINLNSQINPFAPPMSHSIQSKYSLSLDISYFIMCVIFADFSIEQFSRSTQL